MKKMMQIVMTATRFWGFVIPVVCGVMVLTACSDKDDSEEPAKQSTGINISNLDKSVRPADDFFQYACGGWMKNNPLPPAYSRYGTFEQLIEENNKRIKATLDDMLKSSYAAGTTEQKLSELYKLAMDSERRNKDGIQPLMGIISQLEQATNKEELFEIHLQLALQGYTGFMNLGFVADQKKATQNILKTVQGGLILEEKEYYLDTDAETTKIREAYKTNIIKMMQLFGFSQEQATQKMTNIIRLETEMAKVSRSETEQRDPEANYNKMTLAQFNTSYPHIQLEKVMNAIGVRSEYIQELVVGQPEFFAGIDNLIATMTIDEYRDYMEWEQIKNNAEYLDDKTEATYFEFFGKVLSGRQENYPLWQRAINQIEEMMGEALGKLFVEKYFPEASKERMLQLVRNLQTALGERIAAQDWMSNTTKAAAQDKLNTFIVKIGYPEKWKDMSALTIDPQQSYYENKVECRRFWTAYNIEHRAGKPVDRTEWEMTPQTVNAYYSPTTNEICFPAGILQYPFFDMEADDAFNYGAIGVVIGHEMTHGFDDEGRQYDKDGNMRNWWTPDDEAQFKAKADMYAAFFDAIEVLPGLHANGRMTLGENLADHGGLQVAWKAYQNATKGRQLPDVDGLTASQRFFLAYSGVWAQNITEAAIRKLTLGDVHSLGRWRVNGALPHIDAWYEAYGVKDGDKLFIPKEKRLDLW